MNILFRATNDFMDAVRQDLHRPHKIAFERIGFITVRAAQANDRVMLLAEDYHPVADEDYVNDPTVGARIGQEALRKALNLALLQSVGIFHVHMHMIPSRRHWFSRVDLTEMAQFVPDFFSVCSTMPHGAIVLSPRSAAGLAWTTRDKVLPIGEFNFIGPQVQIIHAAEDGSTDYQGW
jgi:hypothetical protein